MENETKKPRISGGFCVFSDTSCPCLDRGAGVSHLVQSQVLQRPRRHGDRLRLDVTKQVAVKRASWTSFTSSRRVGRSFRAWLTSRYKPECSRCISSALSASLRSSVEPC